MKRTTQRKLSALTQVMTEIMSRQGLAQQLGYQYGDKRKLYKALGYPEEHELKFEYYFTKYGRQDIARAIIDRPCDATWRGGLSLVEPDKTVKDSPLNKAWSKLNEELKLKIRLNKVDKLCELGRYSLLLLGLSDVKKKADFKNPVSGGTKKLLYVKQISESEADIHTMIKDTNNPRYGLPELYKIKTALIQSSQGATGAVEFDELIVHHTRVIHYVTGNLTSEVYGEPKLKPIINRLCDLEKLLGGDAEMFWRGARPGYTASAKEDYELGEAEETALLEELDKYEHDLRRFIVSKGIDIEALQQQVSDPLNHVDIQLQAIAAQTGIPKRVLIGSEEAKLAGGQDKDQWLSLIQTRQEEHGEVTILRPFVNRLMEYGILPKVAEYNVMWEDVFAPSAKEKADVGKIRTEALKSYSDSPLASAYISPELAFKHLLGMNEEEVQELLKDMDTKALEEAASQATPEEEALMEEEAAAKGKTEEEEKEIPVKKTAKKKK